MADTWITDMTHFLDQNGAIGVMPDPARKLGDNGLIRNWQGTLWDCWDTKTLQ